MMYKSQFQKNDSYDWFCGPGSHLVCHCRHELKATNPKFDFMDICMFSFFLIISSQADNQVDIVRQHFYEVSLEYVFKVQEVQERKMFEFVEPVQLHHIFMSFFLYYIILYYYSVFTDGCFPLLCVCSCWLFYRVCLHIIIMGTNWPKTSTISRQTSQSAFKM